MKESTDRLKKAPNLLEIQAVSLMHQAAADSKVLLVSKRKDLFLEAIM